MRSTSMAKNTIKNSVIKQSNREGEARTITQVNDEL